MKNKFIILMLCTSVYFVSACTNNEITKVEPTVSPTQTSQPTESVVPTETTTDTLKYQSKDGWSILFPVSWDYTSDDTLNESESEKYISFGTRTLSQYRIDFLGLHL